ncbi:MAG: Ig-like domain-containing protein [Chloroflexota bacterium]
MKKIALTISLVLFVTLLAATAVLAQEEELSLSFSRDFGYSSGGGDIQGLFSMKVSGPDDLVRVVFYIDDTILGEDDEIPFKLQFNTDNYDLGVHTLYAVGTTAGGDELRSREVTVRFVSADEGWQAASRIIGPLLVVVLVATLLSTLLPALGGKRKRGKVAAGEPRAYGPIGGTICPKCNHPYGLQFLAPNMLVGKLQRCPNCGKWAIARRASAEALRAAELAELGQGTAGVQEMTAEEKLQRELDDSKYQGL